MQGAQIAEKTKNPITEGSIWKQLLLFTLPILASNLLQQLYSAVDAVIVGNYASPEEMAAITSVGALSNLFVGLFVGLSTGASVLISQCFGAGDILRVRRAVHTTVALSLFGGIFLMLVGIPLAPQILMLMQSPQEVMQHSATYLRIFFIGMIPMLFYNMGTGILRAIGDSKTPLYFLAISCVLNVGLDFLLVAKLQWGVAGAGWATFFSQTIAACLVLMSLKRTNGPHKLFLKEVRFFKDVMKDILAIGLPAGLQSVVISFSNVVIQSQINCFGALATGGCGAYMKIDGFIAMPLFAFGVGITNFVGQNIGAGKFERAKKSIWICVALSVGVTVAMGCVVLLLGRQVMHIFVDDERYIAYGLQMMSVLAPTYSLLAITNVLVGAVRGAGASVGPMVAQLVTMCAFRVIWISIATTIYDNIFVVFLSYPISWALAMIWMLIYYFQGGWLKRYKRNHALFAKEEIL